MIELNLKYLLLSFVISFFCFSQKNEVQIILNSKELKNCNYELYRPVVEIKMIYKDTLDAVNNTPEQLMTSIISASNQEWVNYNCFGGKEKAAPFSKEEFNKKMRGKEKNYIELLAKLEFSIDSVKYSVVKFRYFQAKIKKPIMGSLLMIYSNSRWFQTSNAKLNNLSMMMLVFKEDILERILSGLGNNQMENNLIKLVYSNGLNIDLLFKQNFNQEQKKYFINDLNWQQ